MRVARGISREMGFFMRGVGKKLAAVLALACLLACAAFGAQSVPGAVLDARQSTVRIVAISGENAFYGTGFTVARNSCYVVTNYHVIEGCSEFEIYLSHDAAVPATVKATAPGADLAVLETAAPLKVPGLALRTSSFDTGLAVWALGFPGGADILTGQEAAGVDEMTVTDGIVSAIKTSRVVGTASQDVQLVQTNTAINQGNSGGPMLDGHGNVVGVNTVGVDGAQNINGAVHVVELINVLEANGIPYKTQSRMGVVLGVAALALCAAGAVLGVFMWKKKGRPRGTGQRAVPLVQFVQAGRRLAPAEAAAAVAAALQEKGTQAHSFCAPQCVLVRGNGIELVKKNGADYRAPGYTAPEIYYGVQGEAGSVYFYGAVLYALTEGAVPPDIPARMNGAPLALGEQNPLRFLWRTPWICRRAGAHKALRSLPPNLPGWPRALRQPKQQRLLQMRRTRRPLWKAGRCRRALPRHRRHRGRRSLRRSRRNAACAGGWLRQWWCWRFWRCRPALAFTPGGRPARWKRLFPMGNMAGHRPYTAVHRG